MFPVGFVNTIAGITEKEAATYNVSTSDQIIAADQYLAGAQTIRGVTTANLSAGNIKAGVTVKVGDAADDDRIAGVAGTFTSDGTAAAGDILNGKISYVNGNKVTGNIPSKAAATYNTSSSDQTISAGQYLSGAQTIRKVTTANLSAGNIKAGVTVKVGDAADDDRIAGVAGTFTSDGTAVAGDILKNKIAYVNGNKITGNIPSLGAKSYSVSTSSVVISAGQYLSGAQTITPMNAYVRVEECGRTDYSSSLHYYDYSIDQRSVSGQPIVYYIEIPISTNGGNHPSQWTNLPVNSNTNKVEIPVRADLLYNGSTVFRAQPLYYNTSGRWIVLLYNQNLNGESFLINTIRVYTFTCMVDYE